MEGSREVLERIDHKNYHAWSFRTWLVAREGLWKQELAFAAEMIEEDAFNNSAWTYRWFLVGKEGEGEDEAGRKGLAGREVAFALENITREKSNRASWNYLRGLFPSISLKDIPSKNAQRGRLV
jgi:protein farnesyltransferase/geranylgeranyltransferase type-1 subunit alpha